MSQSSTKTNSAVKLTPVYPPGDLVVEEINASPATGTLTVGQTVTFTVTLVADYDDDLYSRVKGDLQLVLNDGGVAKFLYQNDTGQQDTGFEPNSSVMTFVTTIKPGENASTLAVTGFDLNGGSIYDAWIGYEPPGSSGRTIYNATATFPDLAVITPAAVISAITVSSSASGILTAGQTVTFTLAPSAPATVTGSPELTLNDGGVATYDAVHSTPDSLVFTTTIQTGQSTPALQVTGVNLNGGAITLAQGNFSNRTNIHAVGNAPQSFNYVDMNGDGIKDIVFFSQADKDISVMLGNNSGGFGHAATYAVDSDPRGMAIADVNGDGIPDVVTTNYYESGSFSVFLGNGSGGFSAQTSYSVSQFSDRSDIVVADFNGDGIADIISSAAGPSYSDVIVLLGNGSGGFGTPTSYSIGATPWGLTLADVNGDGVSDLLFETYTSAVVQYGHSGGFGAPTTYAFASQNLHDIIVADVNGDGIPDLIGADSNSISVRQGEGNGVFGSQTSYATPGSISSVAAADVNGDGLIDLVAASGDNILILPGEGNSKFGAAETYAAGPSPTNVMVADIDGKIEILALDQGHDDSTGENASASLAILTDLAGASVDTSVLPAHSGPVVDASSPLITSVTASPARGIVTNGQTISLTLSLSQAVIVTGLPDLVLNDGGIATYDAAASTATALVFRTTVAPGQVASQLAITGIDFSDGSSIRNSAGDNANVSNIDTTFPGLNVYSEGVSPDAPVIRSIITSPGAGSAILTVGKTATFTLAISNAVTVTGSPHLILSDGGTATYDAAASTPTSLVFTTTIADGQNTPDLRVTDVDLSNGAITNNIFDLLPATSFATGITTLAELTAADINNDGIPDVIEVSEEGTISILLGDGTGGFSAAKNFEMGNTVRPVGQNPVAIADVNGDGKPDLVMLINYLNGPGGDPTGKTGIYVFAGNGDGTISDTPIDYGISQGSSSLVIGDVNGDGRQDIITDGSSGISILLGTESGLPSLPIIYPFSADFRNISGLAVADVTGDGVDDIIVGDNADPYKDDDYNRILIISDNGSGSFGIATSNASSDAVRTLMTADLNGDGISDVVDFGSYGISVILGGNLSSVRSYDLSNYGYWDPVAITDVNGDGALDLVLRTNVSNTNAGGIIVLPGDGSGRFGTATSYAVSYGSDTSLIVADLNGDGKSDFLSAGIFNSNDVSVRLNAGDTIVAGLSPTIPRNDGPAVGTTGLVAPSTTLSVSEQGTPIYTPIRIPAPYDQDYPADELVVIINNLPDNGTVALANGTPITVGQLITVPQLNGLLFLPSYNSPDTLTSSLTYTIMDPGGATASGVATLITIACYARGTLILTEKGEVPVETLRIGDQAVTKDGRLRPIKWLGTRSYAGRFVAGNKDVLPVRIKRGALADGVPKRDLRISPQHAMFIDGVLVPAINIVNGRSIVQENAVDQIDYFHVELDSHDVILAEGAWSETFIDDDSRGMFHNAAEYRVLYPDAVQEPARYCAPRAEEGGTLDRIRRNLLARAQPKGKARRKSETQALTGYLDIVTHERIEGWAYDPARPNDPVLVRLFDNGVMIGQVLADGRRLDLLSAGIPTSAHGFSYVVPGGLSPLIDHTVSVQFAAHGEELRRSPRLLKADTTYRPAVAPGYADIAPVTTLRPAARGIRAPKWRGFVDFVGRERIVGWACDAARPDHPVPLQILDNGVLIARVLANKPRPDLRDAGVGTGRYGFEIVIPGGLSPLCRHVIHVRREEDGNDIADSPRVIEAADRFDETVERSVAEAIAALPPGKEQDRVLSFVVAQADRLLQSRADADGKRSARLAYEQFRRRWGSLAPEPQGEPATAPHSFISEPAAPEPGRRILVIDSQLPDPKRDAGSEAVLSHMRGFQRLGYEVSFAAAEDSDPESQARAELEAMGIHCCSAPFYASVEEVLRRQAGCFDAVYLYRASNASRYIALVRDYMPKARILYSVADLSHLRLERQSRVENRPELARLSQRMLMQEMVAVCSADAVITHSLDEAAIIRERVPGANVQVIPWTVSMAPVTSSFARRSGIAFIGYYEHAPNLDAADWLARTIMPIVRATDPAIACHIVGSHMPETLRRTLEKAGVIPTGHVDDLATLLNSVRLTVAPLRFGAGLKGKVLTSFAAGLPCVMTPVAAEGLALPPALTGCIGETPEEIAALILRLHGGRRPSTPYREASAAGRTLIDGLCGEEAIAAALRAALGGTQVRSGHRAGDAAAAASVQAF